MTELLQVAEGRCPTCGQPWWRAVMCTCRHARATHTLMTRKWAPSVRMSCSHSGCECRKFEQVVQP